VVKESTLDVSEQERNNLEQIESGTQEKNEDEGTLEAETVEKSQNENSFEDDTEDSSETPRGDVVLIVKIEISDGVHQQIEVRKGDDPADLAKQFCLKHQLDLQFVDTIKETIIANLGGGRTLDN